MNFSDRLAKLLKENGLTAKALTERLGIGATSVTDWKRGKSSPSPDVLIGISQILNVSIDYLLNGEEKKLSSSHSATDNADLEQVILARSNRPIPEDEMRIIKKLIDSSIDKFLEAYEDEQKNKRK